MGQFVSDLYQVDELQGLVRSDALPVRYAWVDFKIDGPENKVYLAKFGDEFTVEPHKSLESLRERVEGWVEGTERLRVICAAALPDDGYELIQRSGKIDRAILFCGNKVRANNLMRDYSKIRRACFGYGEVIKVVQGWEKEAEQSLLFYDLQEVEAFNRHNANIRALTDPKISLKEAKDHFKKYCERFLSKEDLFAFSSINSEYSQLRSSQDGLLRDTVRKDTLVAFICKSLLPAHFILEEVNKLLKSSSNPRKLAYLRYVISDLFAAIRDFYREAKLRVGTFLAVIDLNQEEGRRLRDCTNKYVMLTHFLEGTALEPSSEEQLKNGQVLLEIAVPNKAAGAARCNGYLLSGQRALFNLGNYLKVLGVGADGRRVRAALVELPENCGVDWNNKEECLALNHQWLEAQQEKFEGQCFSLLLHDDKVGFSFIGSKISAVQKEKQEVKDKVTFKWTLIRERWRIRNDAPAEQIEQRLQALLQSLEANKGTVLLTLCELFWSRRLEAKFRATVKRLGQYKEVFKEETRAQTFRLYDQFLGSDKKELRQAVLEQLEKQESALMRHPYHLASEAYHLLQNVRIVCLGELGRYEKQLRLIGKMMAIYSVCEGASSPELARLSQLKIAVVARMDEELNLRELSRKKELCTTKVSLDQLRVQGLNEPLPINASKLDFSLFN